MKRLACLLLIFICQFLYSQAEWNENSNDFSTVISQTPDTYKINLSDTSAVIRNADTKLIILEIFLSPFMGTLFTLPSIIFVAARAGSYSVGDYDYLAPYISYVFGTSTCVYILADEFNPLTSFWRILASGLIGAGIGTVIIETKGDRQLNGWEAAAIVSLPVLFEVAYANLINAKPQPQIIGNKIYPDFKRKDLSYKDIYNSTLLFQCEVFRLGF